MRPTGSSHHVLAVLNPLCGQAVHRLNNTVCYKKQGREEKLVRSDRVENADVSPQLALLCVPRIIQIYALTRKGELKSSHLPTQSPTHTNYFFTSGKNSVLSHSQDNSLDAPSVMRAPSDVYAGPRLLPEPGPVWSGAQEMALAAAWLASSSAALNVNVNGLHIYGLAQE